MTASGVVRPPALAGAVAEADHQESARLGCRRSQSGGMAGEVGADSIAAAPLISKLTLIPGSLAGSSPIRLRIEYHADFYHPAP
jgi:hypothetical protein